MSVQSKVMRGFSLLIIYESIVVLGYLLVLVLMDMGQALMTAPFYDTPQLSGQGFVQFTLVLLCLPPVAGLLEFSILRWRGETGTTAALRIRVQLLIVMTVPLSLLLALIKLVDAPLLLIVTGQSFIILIFVIIYSERYRAGLIIFLVTSALMVGVLEFATRRLFPQPVFSTRLPYYPNMSINRNVNLRGVAAQSLYSTNAWGLRGDAVPLNREQTFEIITVGGSTTLCFFLDDAATYPAQLQAALRKTYPQAWVGNAGLDGHTTRGHLLTLETVTSAIQPDGIVFLAGINDLGLSLSPAAQARFDTIQTPWFFNSALFRLLMRQSQILKGAVPVRAEGHGNFVAEPLPDDAAPLADNLADDLPSLPEYRTNLNRLIDLGQQQDVPMLFLTQPMLFEDNPYWAGINGSSYWLKDQPTMSAATYRRMLDIFNATLLEVCQERDVPCYDLAAVISGNAEYFYDAVHFTDAGAARVGEETAKAIEQYWTINR